VVVYTYGGQKADRWWEQNRAALNRLKSLTVINLPAKTTQALAALVRRDLRLHCTIQDGQLLVNTGETMVDVAVTTLKEAQAPVR
jgi:uncharacterized protein YaeQ